MRRKTHRERADMAELEGVGTYQQHGNLVRRRRKSDPSLRPDEPDDRFNEDDYGEDSVP